MVVYSDNEAAYLLQQAADPADLRAVYADLGITPPNFQNPNDTMSPETYARFFRFLYNGTYLDRASSERALEMMSESTFASGLVAGTPQGITISHKFGERLFAERDDVPTAELHDCGIVYHPTHPYLLCVMTQGWERADLATTIQRIAGATYAGVDRMLGTPVTDNTAETTQ
jgi:beta-lactamase class A